VTGPASSAVATKGATVVDADRGRTARDLRGLDLAGFALLVAVSEIRGGLADQAARGPGEREGEERRPQRRAPADQRGDPAGPAL